MTEAPRPSFIARPASGGYVYAVAERPHGGITSFREVGGTLTEIGFVATGTADPCFVEVHPSGEWLLAASYSSGQFTVHPIERDGVAGPPSQVLTCPQPADTSASEISHAHTIRTHPTTGLVIGTDLGGDRVSSFAFNATTGALDWLESMELPTGSGPRHLEFVGPDRMVISCELTPGIVLARIAADGALTVIDHRTVESRPGDAASEIDRVGEFAVMGIRGSDRLVSMRIGDDALTEVDSAPSGGAWPRHLAAIGSDIVVAHQHSDSVDAVEFDAASGTFGSARRLVDVPAAQCILPL
nr:beta-propeller fold lactonase family protein [Spelaeicoccus albus]